MDLLIFSKNKIPSAVEHMRRMSNMKSFIMITIYVKLNRERERERKK